MSVEVARHKVGPRFAAEMLEAATTDNPAVATWPPAVDRAIAELSERRGPCALILEGFDLPSSLGPTPLGWQDLPEDEASLTANRLVCSIGSHIGEAFAWATQQAGAMVHDIAPRAADAERQVGGGSRAKLEWHTEDAFDQLRPRFVVLLCIRNPAAVKTLIGSVSGCNLDAEHARVLRQKRFIISPDSSHLGEGDASTIAFQDQGRMSARVARRNAQPELVALLSGPEHQPHLRLDPVYMSAQEGDLAAIEALEHVCKVVEHSLVGVSLSQGEALVIDNTRAVHGRDPFTARFDGTDRWLKRVLVSEDLSDASERRSAINPALIY